MSLFVIGDTHLSFGTDKPMDIFRGWENFEEKLKNNWLAVVKSDDTVVIPGDITWGMTMETALPDFKFIAALPGTNIIMKGNHDYWWSTNKRRRHFLNTTEYRPYKFLITTLIPLARLRFAAQGAGWRTAQSPRTEK